MGRLIVGLCLATAATAASAEGISQYHMDAIREYHTKQIMGSGQQLTNLQPDVVLYRKIFEKPNTVDDRSAPEPDAIPWAQVFKKADLSFGDTLTLAAAASGYDAHFDPAVDTSQRVKLNTQANSLTDLAEYLTRVTGADVRVYPESRVVLATKKAS